ncbi:MAG: hypothetical protein EA409_08390 [Saprospirales bacterium]|nr:MAG: hypothetical protein EA409_08390 [Saprospirales bacterium]
MIMRFFKVVLLAVFIMLLFVVEAFTQCPMCRMTVESNFADGGTAGLGLNRGIMYLLAAPYLVVGTIGFLYWRSQQTSGEKTENK